MHHLKASDPRRGDLPSQLKALKTREVGRLYSKPGSTTYVLFDLKFLLYTVRKTKLPIIYGFTILSLSYDEVE